MYHYHHYRHLHETADPLSALFPADLARETLDSLVLLFPNTDRKIVKWIGRVSDAARVGSVSVDSTIIKCGRLMPKDRNIKRFKYWGHRLTLLKEVFDDSKPRTLSQRWYDRRPNFQWYPFWTALLALSLTAFFGLVQSIEGAVQAYMALHPQQCSLSTQQTLRKTERLC